MMEEERLIEQDNKKYRSKNLTTAVELGEKIVPFNKKEGGRGEKEDHNINTTEKN